MAASVDSESNDNDGRPAEAPGVGVGPHPRPWPDDERLDPELLEPEDRQVVMLRQWHEFEFAEIGQRMGLSEDAARMRFQRALPKLARKLEGLRRGELE